MVWPHAVDDRPVDARLRALRRREDAKLRRVHPDIVRRILPVGKLEDGSERPSSHDAVRAGHLKDDGLKASQFHLCIKLHTFLDAGLLPHDLSVRSDYAECRRFVHLVAAVDSADGAERNCTAAKRDRDSTGRLDAKRSPVLLPRKAHVSNMYSVRSRLFADIHHRDIVLDARKSRGECCQCCQYCQFHFFNSHL